MESSSFSSSDTEFAEFNKTPLHAKGEVLAAARMFYPPPPPPPPPLPPHPPLPPPLLRSLVLQLPPQPQRPAPSALVSMRTCGGGE